MIAACTEPGRVVLAGATGGAFEEALANELSSTGWRVVCLGSLDDLEQEESVDAAFDEALDRLEQVNGLVVLADLGPCHESLDDGCPESWEPGLTRSLRASFLTLRRAVGEFVAAGEGGRALVILSCAIELSTIQAALAAGLVSLCRAIATEYGRRGIACNVLIMPADLATHEAATNAARFLLSDDARYVTGEVMDLRGAPNYFQGFESAGL